jgi:hypothetical protein
MSDQASGSTIAIEGRRTGYEPGERLRGTVSWRAERVPELVELHLLWYTEGKGDQDVEVVATVPFAPAAQGSAPFELTVPMGPWSVSGKLVSILWALELVVEPGGVTREILAVGPGGQEVQLAATSPPAEGEGG